MDIGGFLNGVGTIDLVLVLYFAAFFVLGFAQGTIRRLLGIASIIFSFLLSANLAVPISNFLAANWHQFPKEYSYMIAFGTLFLVGVIGFALIIQNVYQPQPLFASAPWLDEILGGILGVIEAALLFGIALIILDSYFRIPGMPVDPDELPFLRQIWTWIDATKTAEIFRSSLIPLFLTATGFFVPEGIKASYPAS